MAAAGMSRPIAAMAPPRFTNNFAMKSVTRISVDDFHSIRNWWCAGVSFVEKPDQEWFQYVTETENAQCLCLKIEGEVESYCQADIFLIKLPIYQSLLTQAHLEEVLLSN